MYTCAQRATVKNTNLMWNQFSTQMSLPLSKKQATAGKTQV